MTEYTPQVGDKVTIEGIVLSRENGENLVTIRQPQSTNVAVVLRNEDLTLVSRARPAWTNEPGAVGVDANGKVWQRSRRYVPWPRGKGWDSWYDFTFGDLAYAYDAIPQPLRRLVPEEGALSPARPAWTRKSGAVGVDLNGAVWQQRGCGG